MGVATEKTSTPVGTFEIAGGLYGGAGVDTENVGTPCLAGSSGGAATLMLMLMGRATEILGAEMIGPAPALATSPVLS